MLSTIIFMFHMYVILFLLLTPFCPTSSDDTLRLHIMSIISILVHWLTNNNKCVLTEVEHYVRNKQNQNQNQAVGGSRGYISREKTFFGRLVNPVYDAHKYDDHVTCLLYGVGLMLMAFSVARMCSRHDGVPVPVPLLAPGPR
jgi:hypothetical protein